MKLLRFGPPGKEKPGMLDESGTVRDLSAHVPDISGETLANGALERLAAIDPSTLPKVDASVRLGPCVARPTNFICMALNYVDHAEESNLPIPTEPVFFLKSLGAYCGPYDDVKIPVGSKKTDWEVELGVVIGRTARNVSEANALDHVAGYCIVNDVSERQFQLEMGGTWDKGKGCDTFAPTGPWLVTPDEVGDPGQLTLWLEVDGHRYQNSHTSQLIFGVREVISYVSRFITLHPGDIISTGTPAGVGLGLTPQIYLRAGQVMHLGIEKLGEQRQRLVQAEL
jgi:2,4-didehydro-3-deoxy-L-rhamnonate hydrolase